MTATHPRHKASAVLWLARGKSQNAAAMAAGVSPGTVSTWRRDPAFAAEVERIRAVCDANPHDGQLLMAQYDLAVKALTPASPVRAEDGSVRLSLSIPATATPRQRERLIARAVARGLRAAQEAES